jgi:hypothetical protein
MARIHTHYDNLKVARKAPQEVIRAAYKALSQKYHPDKNPGDEKAARIMAILNSAYGTLADPMRRREHDEWIAAEEWEIEWLESTRAEESRDLLRHDAHWQSEMPEAAPAPGPWSNPRIWLAVLLGLALGGAGGAWLMNQFKVPPAALALAPLVRVAPPEALPVAPAPPARVEPAPDSWAVSRAPAPEGGAQAPQVKALGTLQLVVPARRPDCNMELHTLAAPNGKPWPQASGYLDGFPVANEGGDLQIQVDNSANKSPVLVKVLDLEQHAPVRHVYVLANESMMVERLAAGRYEVRYQNVVAGGERDDCLLRRAEELKQPVRQPVQQAAAEQ